MPGLVMEKAKSVKHVTGKMLSLNLDVTVFMNELWMTVSVAHH